MHLDSLYKKTITPIITLTSLILLGCGQESNKSTEQCRVHILDTIKTSENTANKPQSKLWINDNIWWAVMPNESGTVLWRLDSLQWKDSGLLSHHQNTHADVKAIADTTHALLFRGENSELASLEYDRSERTYRPWHKRRHNSVITLDANTETATLDIDSQKRMWVAYDALDDIEVIWSDPPYSKWSLPIKIATGISTDDICAITSLPENHIAVMWSNQRSKRFGFKTHNDFENPTIWSDDEIPASQSALDTIGKGMADDHINLCVSPQGDLFAAVKTSYDTAGYPKIALLVRRANSNWDSLYHVSEKGTRGIVCLNEQTKKLHVIYTGSEGYNKILYGETALDHISFSPDSILIDQKVNNVTSTKQNYSTDLVVLASNDTSAVGVKIDYR
jgi:hypothetical protein